MASYFLWHIHTKLSRAAMRSKELRYSRAVLMHNWQKLATKIKRNTEYKNCNFFFLQSIWHFAFWVNPKGDNYINDTVLTLQ